MTKTNNLTVKKKLTYFLNVKQLQTYIIKKNRYNKKKALFEVFNELAEFQNQINA